MSRAPKRWAFDVVRRNIDHAFFEPSSQRHTQDRMQSEWPLLNIYETPDAYVVVMEASGLHPEEVEMMATERSLTVTGARNAPASVEPELFRRQERWHGDWKREVSFPKPVLADDITARMTHGLLKVILPLADIAKPRRVDIDGDDGDEPVRQEGRD